MNDMPVNPMNEKPKPTARICVSKEDASNMKVGSSVSLSMSGEVKSLQQSYDNKECYEVEIENPSVEVKESEDKKEDDNMAKMPREKLKEKIQKKDEDYA